ncbi:probable glucan endo-1,3-beta-glucosidase A6 [Rutidosis leptorrhynchoides]|uniref:probable glucan endo-1,3-beta-glucosidase A6 n=1 Tax=Rutidosis leptorrhynchoides TaxID=125765 RepID=UPI003A999B44
MTIRFYDMEKHTLTKMTIMSLSFFFLLASSRAISSKMGVNFGRLGNNLPSPKRSVELLQIMKAGRVKLYDANDEILKLLSTTKIEVTIMVANDEITQMAKNQEVADKWVHDHILNHYPQTMIRYVLVGNEVLSYTSTDQDMQTMKDLVPAMTRLRASLKTLGINNIKVGTPLAMDILESSFPPSSGTFKTEILPEIVPLLNFLSGTKSLFFLDVYPYFSWADNPTGINLDYALFEGNQTYTDPGSGLTYTNLLDQMLDSVFFAMAKLGHNEVMMAIAETGWPHEGDKTQHGSSKENAATYNRNLIKKMTMVPPKGTPAQPGVVIPTFIFSLYDENEKSGPGFERHWGLLNPNGSRCYEVDLSGKAYKTSY